MQPLKNIFRKLRVYLVIGSIAIASVGSFGFVDNYFEISKNLDIFATLFRELNVYYVDETNPGKLIKSSIDAMLETLDPYTNYIPESDIEDYRFMTTGQYGGIGSSITKKGDFVVITEPYEGFPAHKAGLMAGDLILEVNGKSAEGKTTNEISKILKGQANTSVRVLIRREGTDNPIEKTIIREEIKIDNVPYYGMVNKTTGYIKLIGFTETASKEVKDAFKDLKENHGMKSVVLDLRGNGGGLLREAVNIVNIFVDKGQEVVHTKGKIKDWDRIHRALNNPVDKEIPVVVLIDRGSASASEIVSGALQDLDRGVVIGQKSFGKGLVQQTRNLTYNSKLKVTVAKYYIPSGRCIQRIDYSHKDEDGVAKDVPDSLITKFKTMNGRTVFDGEGIIPDLTVEQKKMSPVTGTLVSKMLVFDFATQYRLKKDSLKSAKTFQLSDEEYEAFIDFLKGKDYAYTTKSEIQLEKLEKTAQKEKYFDDIKKEYDQLKKKMEDNKTDDLTKFEKDIKEVLEDEIVSRYYYYKGRIEHSLANDEEVGKAIKVLKDQKLYASILDGTYQDEETKSAKKN